MERREDLAKRGWRALEGGGDEAGRDPLGQAVDFEEELDEELSTEEDPVTRGARDAGNVVLGRGDGEGAAAEPAAAAASGSASATAWEDSSCREAGVRLSSSDDEPMERPQSAGPRAVDAVAIGAGRRLTTKPWRRDPDWLYPSFIGVPAREAALARGAGGQRPTALADQDTPEDLGGAEASPKPPTGEGKEAVARLGSGSTGTAGMSDEGTRPGGPRWAALASQQSVKRRRLAVGPTEGRQAAAAPVDRGPHEFSPGGASDDDAADSMNADSEDQPLLRRHGDRGDGGTGAASSGLGGPQRALVAPPRGAGVSNEMGGSFEAGEGPPEEAHQRRLDSDGRARDGDARRGPSEIRKRRGDAEHLQAGPQGKRMRRLEERATGGELPERGGLGDRAPRGDDAAVQQRQFGRRYLSVSGDPVDAADARGHVLFVTGPAIWCGRCGRYAFKRLGKALKADCPGVASGVYGSRLSRLREGLHPISGKNLL